MRTISKKLLVGLSLLVSSQAYAVNGHNCVPPVPDVGYRSSLYECNGNAAIILRGSQRGAYSVVVRRQGQFNDRDPANPSCGSNRCSPYKTQKKIEFAEYQVNCLGASGHSSSYAEVSRISIKYAPGVEDPTDPRQFQQYCIANTHEDFN